MNVGIGVASSIVLAGALVMYFKRGGAAEVAAPKKPVGLNDASSGYINRDGTLNIESGFMTTINNIALPRGIRNNNPLNIKWSMVNPWHGQTGSDGIFSTFDKPENGIRAAAKILDRYAERGVVKLGDIIKTWAPATENNVEAYLAHVESVMGKSRGSVISKSAGDYVPLLAVMIKHENGVQPYPIEVIAAGVALS